MSEDWIEVTYGDFCPDQAVVSAENDVVHLDTSDIRITLTPRGAMSLAGWLIREAAKAGRAADALAQADAAARS